MTDFEKHPVHQDYIDGYTDGGDINIPEPGPNRSARYVHSFKVRRAEMKNTPINSWISWLNVEKIEREEDDNGI